HYEPFSNVILEAMSFQNVVITTKQNGASEILDSPFVMQSPQDFSIVKTIDELLENAQKIEAIKQRNYEIVQNFTIEKNAQETMEVINEYLH
ncbi:MAG: glycosyltransferase, partial [Sulfurospirillum sp.]|nr:glycosyltransferase [Sulfurospirillum sp.]